MRFEKQLSLIAVSCLLSGCGFLKDEPAEEVASPFGPTGIPAELRKKPPEGGVVVTAGGNRRIAPITNYSPDDLVWTDPDDPDAVIPELQGLMAVKPQDSPWRESEREAIRESKQSGKPLLVWFTDSSGRCPACQTLSSTLLTRSDFEVWASSNVVRLIADVGVKGKDIEDDARKKLYVRNLKKKYSVRGLPTLMVITPSGDVIGRYKNYRKGKEDFLWGQAKQGVMVANDRHKSWKETMENKGYRDWSDGKGKTIFAKLAAYNDGNLLLVEPDGQRARTHEKRLSAKDRVWIQHQKEQRGIQ